MKVFVVQTPHYDFNSANLIEGLARLATQKEVVGNLKTDIELGCVETSNYAVTPEWNFQVMPDDYEKWCEEAAIIFITSNNDVRADIVDKKYRSKTAYLDGEDTSPYREKPGDYPIYFKREMLLSEDHPENVISCPFAMEDRYVPPLGSYPLAHDFRGINLSCMFGPHDDTKPWRFEIEQKLLAMDLPESIVGQLYGGQRENASGVDTGNREHAEYYSMLAKSKMSVDAYGAHGCNAARFWEIIGQGSLLITQPVMIFMPYPFLEGQDYWEFKDMDQLEFVVRYALDNPDQTADMAKSAHSHALQYHSSPARVIYMLREANKFIPDCANIFTSVG